MAIEDDIVHCVLHEQEHRVKDICTDDSSLREANIAAKKGGIQEIWGKERGRVGRLMLFADA